MKLEDVIRSKGNSVVTITPQASVSELVALLAQHNIGAVVVSADGKHIDGIVSERDVVQGLASEGPEAVNLEVVALMTADVVVGKPSDGIEETAHIMTTKRIRHIPLVIDTELCGLVSIGDVVKYRIDQLTDERNHLLGYLHQ